MALTSLSITALRENLVSKEISPQEVLDSLEERIATVDERVHGYLSHDLALARECAKDADLSQVEGAQFFLGRHWGNRIFDGPNGMRQTSVEATVFKGTTFADVPFNYPYWRDIEILNSHGLTGGCSTNPLKFCPDQIMDRAQASVFMMRGAFGSSYVPNPSANLFQDNWTPGTWARPWAEAIVRYWLSTCGISSRMKKVSAITP